MAPRGPRPALAWGVDIPEAARGLSPLLGFQLRCSAWLSAALLLVFAVSMATLQSMTIIVSPKADWLKQLGVAGGWPMAGLPKCLHLDGAAEFKSKALRRGCGW